MGRVPGVRGYVVSGVRREETVLGGDEGLGGTLGPSPERHDPIEGLFL